MKAFDPAWTFLLACVLFALPHGGAALAGEKNEARAPTGKASDQPDGQHDFDFAFGHWKTHVKRLLHPLSGSTTWAEYQGTSVVRKIWGGGAHMVELDVTGPAGRIEGISLRLYNPQSHQWSLNFASRASGTLSVPTIGGFRDGRGEFYDHEQIGGRMVLVRNVWSDITPESARFEQAFSDDGGKTWEVNWIAIDTRADAATTEAGAPKRD
jgi:hypothetical protein